MVVGLLGSTTQAQGGEVERRKELPIFLQLLYFDVTRVPPNYFTSLSYGSSVTIKNVRN